MKLLCIINMTVNKIEIAEQSYRDRDIRNYFNDINASQHNMISFLLLLIMKEKKIIIFKKTILASPKATMFFLVAKATL